MEAQINKSLLKSYLKNKISVHQYFQVIEQIVAMLKNSQGKGFTFSLNIDMMQIQNGKIQFQMTAEDSMYELLYIKNFLKELTFAAIFAPLEDCAQVTEFLRFLDREEQSSDLDRILTFIENPNQIRMKSQAQVQSRTQQIFPEDGETGVLGAGFWEQLENRSASTASSQDISDETGVLEPSFWENALKNTPSTRLDNERTGNMIYGRLVHIKTGKQTIINRDNFWIGKEDVDLQINKEVISRRHAVIISRANHYFISDNGSTNKTFVNNKEIPAKASVEIFAGTRIKFANEEYEFQL